MRLIDCFADTISYVSRQMEAIRAGQHPEYEELRLGVERLLSEHATYSAGGFTREQYDAAKFAVVALIDETILLSDWPHRDAWTRELLQRSHFQTANAGEEFFQRLDELSPFDPAEGDIREVYYYCLALGFVGQFFRPGDRARLDELRHVNFKLLRDSEDRAAAQGQAELFPGSRMPGEHGYISPPAPRRPAFYYGVPLLLALAAFVYFRLDLLRAGESLANLL